MEVASVCSDRSAWDGRKERVEGVWGGGVSVVCLIDSFSDRHIHRVTNQPAMTQYAMKLSPGTQCQAVDKKAQDWGEKAGGEGKSRGGQ